MSLKKLIDAGDLEGIKLKLESSPTLATHLIKWGPFLSPCHAEPLHYLSDGSFHLLWDHGKQGEIASMLIEAGAPVDGLPESGESPLHGAVSLGEFAVAEILIDHGANLELKASYQGIPDGTPLDFAVHFGMVEIIDLLVRKGANVCSARMAAGAGMLELLKEKLKPEQEIDVFRCACVCDRIEIVDYFLNGRLDVNVDIEGATGLHWAAWEAKPTMVKHLLKKGADHERRDSTYNMTPREWAAHREKELGSRWGHGDVRKCLA